MSQITLCKFCRTALEYPRQSHPCLEVYEIMAREMWAESNPGQPWPEDNKLAVIFWERMAKAALKSFERINLEIRSRY